MFRWIYSKYALARYFKINYYCEKGIFRWLYVLLCSSLLWHFLEKISQSKTSPKNWKTWGITLLTLTLSHCKEVDDLSRGRWPLRQEKFIENFQLEQKIKSGKLKVFFSVAYRRKKSNFVLVYLEMKKERESCSRIWKTWLLTKFTLFHAAPLESVYLLTYICWSSFSTFSQIT